MAMVNGPAAPLHPYVVYGPKALGSKFIARFSNLKCAAASVVWHGKYYWCQLHGTENYKPEEYTYEECSRLMLASGMMHMANFNPKTLINRDAS